MMDIWLAETFLGHRYGDFLHQKWGNSPSCKNCMLLLCFSPPHHSKWNSILFVHLLFFFSCFGRNNSWSLVHDYWCFAGHCMGTNWLGQYLKKLACWDTSRFWIWGWINCRAWFLQILEIWLVLWKCKRNLILASLFFFFLSCGVGCGYRL